MNLSKKPLETPPPALLTSPQLAEKIGRSSEGVKRAIRRLRIQPAAVTGRVKLYAPETAEMLHENMKARREG